MKAIRILAVVVILLGCVFAGSLASFRPAQPTRQDVWGALHLWLTESGAKAIENAQRAVRGTGSSAPLPVEQLPDTDTPVTPTPVSPDLDVQQEAGTPTPTPAPTAVEPAP